MSSLETSLPATPSTFPPSNGKMHLGQYWSELENRVRQQPNQYLAIALALGFLLRTLPIGALLVLIVRILAVLIKPTIVVLALANIAKLMAEREQSSHPLS